MEANLSWTWLSKIQVLVQRTCFFQNKNVRGFPEYLLRKGSTWMDEGYSHLHPSHPKQKKAKKRPKKKKKEKNRLVRELLGNEEGRMNLDDSTGQTPSVILSGMNYLTRSSSSLSSSI